MRPLREEGPSGPAADAAADLAGREIADVHKASRGTYGALRVTAELRYARNIVVGHNAVESIMPELGSEGWRANASDQVDDQSWRSDDRYPGPPDDQDDRD